MDDLTTNSPEIILSANAHIDDASPILSDAVDQMEGEQIRHTRAEQVTPFQLYDLAQLGRFMPPRQASYAAHHQLCNDRSLALYFSAQHQPAFDAPLAAHVPPPLRPTLAILRNALMQQLFAAGHTPKRAVHFAAMSRFLRQHFEHGRGATITPDGAGAQALYCLLLARQNTPLWRMPSVWLTPDSRPQRWGLLALNDSPFSDSALRLPPPAPDTKLSAIADVFFGEMTDRSWIDPAAPNAPSAEQTTAEALEAIANELASAGALTLSVESLHEPTRREAIEIAKDILDKLRVSLGSALLTHGITLFEFNPLTLLSELQKVVKAFEFHLHKVAGLDALIYDNPAIIAANSAVGKLSFLAKQETLKAAIALGDTPMITRLHQDLSQLPRGWNPLPSDGLPASSMNLESGLKTVVDRMNHLANKDTSTASWLGFSAEKTLGSQSHGSNDAQPQKVMQDDSFFRQLNAQRALVARQAAVRYSQQQQRHQHDHEHPKQHPPAPTQANANLNQLVASDMLASMRSAMKTASNAAAVETGTKANLQQVIRQKEQATKAQQQRNVAEQAQRASDRSHAQEDAAPKQPIQPPMGKKKDPKLGM